MHTFKMTEWQTASGYWCCNDVEDLGKGSGYWWHPARMMEITPAAYVEWVIKNFKPDRVSHSDDCSFVGFSWKDQDKMRKYKNHINRIARQKNYKV